MQAAVLPPPGLPPRAEAPAAAPSHALDDPGEWESFGRPLAGREGCWESYLAIEGIYCAGCSLTIEHALAPLPGVQQVDVNGSAATARIVWDAAQGRPSQWLAALERAGYRGLPAGDQLQAVPRRQAQRLLLWRWLVAGFCMMQVMMYAVPAYVAEPGDMTPDVAALLNWAAWLLTLPVLLFSCRPFFSSAWRDLRHRRIGMDVPVSLGILIAFGASTAATFDPTGPLGGEVWYDSVTMFVFFLLSGRLLEQRLRDRTAGALEALVRRLPDTVERVAADGSSERVPVRRLAVGDRIRVQPGAVFPADGEVLQGDTQVDEALLTGESTPLPRHAGQGVIAGSANLGGVVLVRVDRVGDATRYGQFVALMERASHEKPGLARLADRFATPFLLAVVAAAAGAAWWWWPQGPGHALGVAVAVLIVTCPCALSLATPAATLAAAGALARRGILVRRLEALETGAEVDTVVFDKTGTLTTDRMGVREVRTRDGVTRDEALALAAGLARNSLHPASRAVAAAGGVVLPCEQVHEHAGQGVEGVLPGAAPRRLRLGSAAFCGVAPLAGTDAAQVHLADDAGWLASFELDESLRGGALAAVAGLRRLGLQLEVLSGDQDAAVQRLAGRAGIRNARGQQSPQDKLDHVAGLQQSGRRVAMVGDGMNDGPVLARADLSIALGEAVPVAQARSDFIVQGGQLAGVAAILAQARRTRAVVRQNLWWAAGYNAVCVPLAIAGLMPPWLAGLGMAASSLFVVLNAARLSVIPAEAGTQGFRPGAFERPGFPPPRE
ncbi:cadmium-translocating P-type ATPase [Ramlibacter sp. USB13]|uniref:Cadmium-translocating P-type ATPase n=1 Tax=Ramlibacter cellulosilyticus TaxID=2764187 RepID=A0A923SAS8_9BURK|nr:cation-translocating P-type ATPase [Ramlibacter cellulosilyticus]MBC5783115.1 cadmium-translocating P-type ATPase [Ramlibacter cellulosilyticus]